MLIYYMIVLNYHTLENVNAIQNTDLKIALKSFHTTANPALHVKANFLPQKYRGRVLVLKYASNYRQLHLIQFTMA